MDTHTLILKLDQAAARSLYLAEQEQQKTAHDANLPHDAHHARAVTRENFFRGQYDTILAIKEELITMNGGSDSSSEEKEDVIFLARKLITGVSYPWIRRRILDEWLYGEVRKDVDFEPYTADLPHKKEAILKGDLSVLGLPEELEQELSESLRKLCAPQDIQYHAKVQDVIEHMNSLSHFFKDDWTKKTNLICFRLYEYGLVG